MPEREALARDNALPLSAMQDISDTYTGIAAAITGKPIQLSDNPKAEIVDILNDHYGLIL